MNVAELKRQVEYKFAPEPLLAVQALANTYDFEAHDRGEELLDSPDAVRGWLLTSGLAAPTVEVGEEDRNRLITFRDAIRLMLEANSHGELSKADLTEWKGLAERYPVPLDAGPGGRLELDLAPPDSVDGVIAQLLGIAFRSQLAGEWERLKICASDECRWAFFDASRNRGGTWCQMEVCGNRVKNRAYRKRQSKSARP